MSLISPGRIHEHRTDVILLEIYGRFPQAYKQQHRNKQY